MGSFMCTDPVSDLIFHIQAARQIYQGESLFKKRKEKKKGTMVFTSSQPHKFSQDDPTPLQVNTDIFKTFLTQITVMSNNMLQ